MKRKVRHAMLQITARDATYHGDDVDRVEKEDEPFHCLQKQTTLVLEVEVPASFLLRSSRRTATVTKFNNATN